MEISTDSWRYKFWRLLFLGGHLPTRTTRARFWTRIILVPSNLALIFAILLQGTLVSVVFALIVLALTYIGTRFLNYFEMEDAPILQDILSLARTVKAPTPRLIIVFIDPSPDPATEEWGKAS
jgi:hypothetical protein